MVRYPIALEEDDNDTWLVSFPDFPEAHTYGDSPEEAIARAHDALATIVVGYIRSRRPIPSPSPIKTASAELSALMSAKVELYNAMLETGTTKTALARKLDWHMPQVDRLFDLTHGSRVDQLEAAAAALGGKFEVTLFGPRAKGKTVSEVLARSRARARSTLKTATRASKGRQAARASSRQGRS